MRFLKTLAVNGLVLAALGGPAAADVTVTTLANQGVVISDGVTRVMIDGLVVDPYSIYAGLPASAAGLFERREGPFADVDLVLVSHRHHEHNQPAYACRFLQNSRAQIVTSGQVIGLMREKCRTFMTTSERVREIDPQPGSAVDLQVGQAHITVFPLSHGKRKYARIQHFGHLVEMGGVTVLHVGDAAVDERDFEAAGLQDRSLDVALIPFRFFEPGRGEAIVQRYMNARVKIAVHIPPDELEEVRAWLAETRPEVHVPAGPLEVFAVSADLPPP